jgi:hypothetical protein
MTVNTKRSFLRGAGLFGLFAGIGSAAVAESLPASLPEVKEDISHLAPPQNATTIQFTGAYGKQPEPQPVSATCGNSFYINGYNQETTHKVSMSVGLDNRLWIKVGDEWRRVALES